MKETPQLPGALAAEAEEQHQDENKRAQIHDNVNIQMVRNPTEEVMGVSPIGTHRANPLNITITHGIERPEQKLSARPNTRG